MGVYNSGAKKREQKTHTFGWTYLNRRRRCISFNITKTQNNFQFGNIQTKFKKPVKLLNNSFIIEDTNLEKKEFILWVARSDYGKRPELFIKLAEYFPKEKFVMIMPKSETDIWEK